MQIKRKERQLLTGRIFALFLLVLEIGIMFAYGYASNFPTFTASNPQTDFSDQILLYTFTALLAILGYGLLIAYSDDSAIAGLVTTLIVVSVSVQITPLLLQFWSSVFNGFGPSVEISLAKQRITMVLCTSLLASLTALVGKLGKIQTLLVVLIYNIGWTLSFIVTQYIHDKKSPTSPSLYDDYGTNYVYVFAGFFAIITSLIMNIKPGKVSPTGSRHSAFIGLVGTGFIFACFPFTGVLFNTESASNVLKRDEGPLNIYFALTASVICTYLSGMIFGGFKIGVRESLVGVLSGGATIGVVAGNINNIGACIAIGAFSGLFSGFWLRVVHPRLNATKSIDHLGIFGPILICSIIGGLVLSPALYKSYLQNGTITSGTTKKITDSVYISYQLAYIGIAAGTAIVAGLLAGLLILPFRDSRDDYEFTKIVSDDYGLYHGEGENYREGGEEEEEQPAKNNNNTNNALNTDAL